MIFTKSNLKNSIYFYDIFFFHVNTALLTLKGSRIIYDFALIRAVLLLIMRGELTLATKSFQIQLRQANRSY